jgi:hypothetical protein
VGVLVGIADGDIVGAFLGIAVGDAVGALIGIADGDLCLWAHQWEFLSVLSKVL